MTTSLHEPDALLLPPVPDEEFRHFMRHWPTGVAIVTTAGADGPSGCTVSAMTSLSMEPPLLVVSLRVHSRTLEAIRQAGRFGASVLASDQGELSHRFAHCPHGERFPGLSLRVRHGVPLIADAAAQVVCTVWDTMRCADHVLAVGVPVWQSVEPERAPLLLHRGSHRRIVG
jgi:flavin reductase (DIM6/NTAB) family NADH-FMN oxidoreductase RutF